MKSVNKSGIDNQRIYFNTGTWRTLHKEGIEDESFISYKTLTFLGIFKDDERMGRAFEFWMGALDL